MALGGDGWWWLVRVVSGGGGWYLQVVVVGWGVVNWTVCNKSDRILVLNIFTKKICTETKKTYFLKFS